MQSWEEARPGRAASAMERSWMSQSLASQGLAVLLRCTVTQEHEAGQVLDWKQATVPQVTLAPSGDQQSLPICQ